MTLRKGRIRNATYELTTERRYECLCIETLNDDDDDAALHVRGL